MGRLIRITLLLVGVVGVCCALIPIGSGRVTVDGVGNGFWGVGIPQPWLTNRVWPDGFEMLAHPLSSSAILGAAGLLSLAVAQQLRRSRTQQLPPKPTGAA
jgi:hypothetical protein